MPSILKRFLLPAILAVSLAVLLFAAAVRFGAFGSLPSAEELKGVRQATASLVLDEQGELIGKFFEQNRSEVDFGQFPPHLIDALIATEDVRFFQHRGYDPRGLLRVAVKTVLLNNKGAGGGSTITQQLAKNLYGRTGHGLWRMLVDKTREIFLARRMEKALSKKEILTLYLNTVPFGENVYGIEAAARRFFSKGASELSVEESAVLVGLLKANTAYNPRLYPDRARARRNVVLAQMNKYGFLEQNMTDSLSGLDLILRHSSLHSENRASYFLVHVRQEARQILDSIEASTGKRWVPETDGLSIHTTLNLDMQAYAMHAFRTHLSEMQKKLHAQYASPGQNRNLVRIVERELQRTGLANRAEHRRLQWVFDWEGSFADSLSVRDSLERALQVLHAGLLAMDPHSGAILTYVGGINYATHPFDQVKARRQLASAFKPVLYAAALENGMNPCQMLDNDSLIITNFKGYSPVNHDGSYGGKYSMAGALAYSVNIPGFHVFMRTGFDAVDRLWQNMGFSFQLQKTPSLAFGTAEASIMELARAYAAFVNNGMLVHPHSIRLITDPQGNILYQHESGPAAHQLISGSTSLLMGHMLQKAVNEGTGTSVRTRFGVSIPLGGKTGTSQNYADAWFASINPNLVMVSRVGASLPSVHFSSGSHGSGSALALPLVALSLQQLEKDPELRIRFSQPFPELPGTLARMVDCPDYRETRGIERFFDRFRDKSVTFGEEKEEEPSAIESFFKRILKSFK